MDLAYAESQEGEEAKGNGDDRLSGDVPLVLAPARVLVGVSLGDPDGCHRVCYGHWRRMIPMRKGEKLF